MNIDIQSKRLCELLMKSEKKRDTEEDFIKQYGGGSFFDGGDAEAQYVYRRLKDDGWIE